MQTRHNLDCVKRNRSTSGLSGLNSDEIGDLFCNFISEKIKRGNIDGRELSNLLRLAAQDLKACYLDELSAQPGQSTDSAAFTDWFWGETHAALVINEVRKSCLQHPREDVVLTGMLQLIPMDQMYRFNG